MVMGWWILLEGVCRGRDAEAVLVVVVFLSGCFVWCGTSLMGWLFQLCGGGSAV